MKRKITKIAAAILAAVMLIGGMNLDVQAAASDTYESTTYESNPIPIMGSSDASLSQMINLYESHAQYPYFYSGTDAPTIYEFCRIYVEECEAEGVRADVAFSQAMKETGYLRYGGDVRIEQFNFAGIGATGGGNPGHSFPSVRIGIRAQVQHLKAYASTAPLNQSLVDPRFDKVRRGCSPYVQTLGTAGWATAGNYGESIVADYMTPLLACSNYSTWYQGMDYSKVYNPNYYMLKNPDVASGFGANSDLLLYHFVNCGMAEGRIASPNFNVMTYRERYKDLRQTFGTDNKAYYIHYIKYGSAEGRSATGTVDYIDGVTVYNGIDYAAVYNYNYYIKHYPDLKAAFGNDDLAALRHFVDYGMKEGRQASDNFNFQSYYNSYQDLRVAFRGDKKQYYLHYMNYGYREGRTATGVTSLQNPVTVYNGVDYSKVFDYYYYSNNYADLRAAYGDDDTAFLIHFITYGMREGRQASAAFSLEAYKANNVDLQQAFGGDNPFYYIHYMNYGRKEGRIAQ